MSQNLAMVWGRNLLDISAKTGDNVSNVFETVVRDMRTNKGLSTDGT